MNLANFSIEIRFKSEYLRISLYFSVYCILLYVIKNMVIAEDSRLLHKKTARITNLRGLRRPLYGLINSIYFFNRSATSSYECRRAE